MEEKLIEQLQDVFEMEDSPISLDDKFRDFENWDSLTNLSLIAMLDEEFDIVIDNKRFKEIQTVGELLEEIKNQA